MRIDDLCMKERMESKNRLRWEMPRDDRGKEEKQFL